jgi:Bacterial lipoate protein ligase C-terminus.
MVQTALVDAFNAAYGQTETTPIDFKTLPQAQENYHRFGDLSVILEKTPQFTHSFTHRFEWGEATLHLQVEKGVISEVRMFTDALDTSIVDRAVAILSGAQYNQKALEELAQTSGQADLASLLAHVVSLL